jgi:arsenite-transporting ATPase
VPEVTDPAPLPGARLLLVAGKGGVGKTTVAAATALRLAGDEPGRDGRVLVASTDPAHSLFDVLGLRQADLGAAAEEVGTEEPVEVAPGLHAAEIDAQGRFEKLREDYASEVRRFFAEAGGSNLDLPYDRPVAESLVDLAPPGIDEVMGWLAVMEFLEGDTYHTCVVDTAPTGHFVRLLETPDLFAEWIRALFRILRNHRDVLRLPDLNDRLVRLSKQVRRWNGLLNDGTASVVGVALPRPVVAAETRDLHEAVRRRGAAMPVLAINRVTPPADRSETEASVIKAYRSALPDAAVPLVHNGPTPETVSHLQALGTRLYQT